MAFNNWFLVKVAAFVLAAAKLTGAEPSARQWFFLLGLLGAICLFVTSPTLDFGWLQSLPLTILRLFYDNLEEDEKHIFVDATIFFCNNENWTLREAKVAWKAVYGAADKKWGSLVWKGFAYDGTEFVGIEGGPRLQSVGRRIVCGLTAGSWQEFWSSKRPIDDEGENESIKASVKVDPLLQDLGRRIALESNNYGKWTVWDKETASKRQTKDGKEIRGLRLVRGKEDNDIIHINSAVVPKLKDLQFLEANVPVFIDGNVDQDSSPTELVLLKCLGRQIGQGLFKPSLQTRLAVLKVFDSRVYDLQLGSFHTLPKEIGKLRTLQYLQFNSCHKLQTLTESFGHLKALEHLEFKNCEALRRLPESFGDLKNLRHLIFRKCSGLKVMPGTFQKLKALRHLQFVDCPQLMALPLCFHNLSNLRTLRIVSCQALHEIPTTLGSLRLLTKLTIWNCKTLKPLPDELQRNLYFVNAYRFLTVKYKPYGEHRHFAIGLRRQ